MSASFGKNTKNHYQIFFAYFRLLGRRAGHGYMFRSWGNTGLKVRLLGLPGADNKKNKFPPMVGLATPSSAHGKEARNAAGNSKQWLSSGDKAEGRGNRGPKRSRVI